MVGLLAQNSFVTAAELLYDLPQIAIPNTGFSILSSSSMSAFKQRLGIFYFSVLSSLEWTSSSSS
jgi:hypothetical protein